jgi:hypothetical protein
MFSPQAEDLDARLARLEEWTKSQQNRLAEEEHSRWAEEQRRLAGEEIARRRYAEASGHFAAQAQPGSRRVKVYAPFTAFAPGVREALKATGHPVTEVYVGGRDDAYWELLNGLWSEGQSFIVVEHDIVVRAETFEELESCPYQWCSFGSPYFMGVYHGLGCVKFSDRLISRHPRAMEQVAAHPPDEKHPPKHYCRLDAYLQLVLSGEYRHRHETVLEHVRSYDGPPRPGHGCVDWRV